MRPQLEYACSLWNPYAKRNIHQIELVQHRAARFVFRDYSKFSHVTLQPRPQGFSLKKWVGREKALASAGHVSPRTP